MVTRKEEGRTFHRKGKMVAKDVDWTIAVIVPFPSAFALFFGLGFATAL